MDSILQPGRVQVAAKHQFGDADSVTTVVIDTDAGPTAYVFGGYRKLDAIAIRMAERLVARGIDDPQEIASKSFDIARALLNEPQRRNGRHVDGLQAAE